MVLWWRVTYFYNFFVAIPVYRWVANCLYWPNFSHFGILMGQKFAKNWIWSGIVMGHNLQISIPLTQSQGDWLHTLSPQGYLPKTDNYTHLCAFSVGSPSVCWFQSGFGVGSSLTFDVFRSLWIWRQRIKVKRGWKEDANYRWDPIRWIHNSATSDKVREAHFRIAWWEKVNVSRSRILHNNEFM